MNSRDLEATNLNKKTFNPIQETLRLAKLAKWVARPNPAVGAILLEASKASIKMGQGATHSVGGIHAEIHALNNLKPLDLTTFKEFSDSRLKTNKKQLYVSLAPCTFQGRTPPCVEAIVKANVETVHIGLNDNDPRMNDAFTILKNRGVKVQYAFPESVLRELFWLNADYYFKQHTGYPLVTVKYAMSLDGSIATGRGRSKWITGEIARKDANLLRGQCDAVWIGARTFILDAPRLRTQLPKNLREDLHTLYARANVPIKEPRPFILLTRDFSKQECETLEQRLKATLLDSEEHSSSSYQSPVSPWFCSKTSKLKLNAAEQPVFLLQKDFKNAKQVLETSQSILHFVNSSQLSTQIAFRELIRELAEIYQLNSIFVEGGAHNTSLFRWSEWIQRMIVYWAPRVLIDDGMVKERALPPFLPVRSYLPELPQSFQPLIEPSSISENLSKESALEGPFQALHQVSYQTLGNDMRMLGYLNHYETLESLWKKLSPPNKEYN